MRKLMVFFALTLAIASCTDEPTEAILEESSVLTDEQKAEEFLVAVATGEEPSIAYVDTHLFNEQSINSRRGDKHPNGKRGSIEIIRLYRDRNYVFAHSIYTFPEEEETEQVGFDILNFERGRIIEWYRGRTPLAPPNLSGRTQTDGPTRATDLRKTEENKGLVLEFLNTAFIERNIDKIPTFFDGNNYIQHNSFGVDGLEFFLRFAEQAQGEYNIVLTVGKGNFVLVLAEGSFMGQTAQFFDLYRVENGKIAEHWDVIDQAGTDNDL